MSSIATSNAYNKSYIVFSFLNNGIKRLYNSHLHKKRRLTRTSGEHEAPPSGNRMNEKEKVMIHS